MRAPDQQATIPLLGESELRQRWDSTLRALPNPGDAAHLGRSFRPRLAESAPSPAPPQAPYSVIEELGRGGMGVVYRARQESLGREVALKTILDEADLSARSAFLAEARVTGWLEHPNIVPVYGLDYAPGNGQPFLSMKVVRGLSWKDLLHPRTAEHKTKAAERDRPKDDLVTLKAVCNALAYSHDRGIAHLDLKPENIMIGEYGEVLVMDWGTALDIRDEPLDQTRARHKSSLRSPCGTPIYMAPELANGEGRLCGPWTDVYLLGAILYEILTGRPPHQGKSLLQVIFKAASGEPPRFTAKEKSRIPQELRQICSRAMQREPFDRYENVRGFQKALDDFLEHLESFKLCVGAERALKRAEDQLSERRLSTPDRLAELTSELAEAASGFRQALSLWKANPRARKGARAAQILYVRTALDHGDLSLARAQAKLLDDGEESRELHREVSRAERAAGQSEGRKLLLTRASWSVAALASLLLITLSTLYFMAQASDKRERRQTAKHIQTLEKQRSELDEKLQRAEAERVQLAMANRRLQYRVKTLNRSPSRTPRSAAEETVPAVCLDRVVLLTADPRVGGAIKLRLSVINQGQEEHGVLRPYRRGSYPLGTVTVSLARRDGRPFRTRNGRAGLQKQFRLLRKSLLIRPEPWRLKVAEQAEEDIALIARGFVPGEYRLIIELSIKDIGKSRLETDVSLQ